MNKDCPTQDNLSKFLSGEISANERDTFELHLAECADCRSNLALMFSEKADVENFVAPNSLKEKAKNLPEKSKGNSASFFSFDWLKTNRLQVGFASILLSCFALAGIYFLQNQTSQSSEDVLRNGTSNKTSIQLLFPEDNKSLSSEKVEFRWSQLPNVKNYTLILSDEKGDIIKEISSDKTNIETSISELGLAKNKRCFWHVKAKFMDGTISESESRKILVVAN